jgi:hypothetical protein
LIKVYNLQLKSIIDQKYRSKKLTGMRKNMVGEEEPVERK